MFCSKCGKEINDNAVICIHCGCATVNNRINTHSPTVNDDRDWSIALVLAIFLGIFGAHRFYTGHIAIAIAQLFTAGGCGLWALIDLIRLCANHIKDEKGHKLKKYNEEVGLSVFIIIFLLIMIGCIIFTSCI